MVIGFGIHVTRRVDFRLLRSRNPRPVEVVIVEGRCRGAIVEPGRVRVRVCARSRACVKCVRGVRPSSNHTYNRQAEYRTYFACIPGESASSRFGSLW